MQYAKYAALPIAAIVIFLFFFVTQRTEPTETLSLTTIEQPEEVAQDTAEQPPPAQTVTVDVKGAVHYPGVYTFTTEHRIIDAIEAAGGYVAEADSKLINHAQKLADELIIYVPKVGEEPPVIAQTASSTTNSTTSPLININTATQQELETLPGIGPAKAQAIITHREEQGLFASNEGLKDVTGIGDKSFEQLSDLITVK